MSGRFIRFHDLKVRGIVNSWAQLGNLIEKYDFPPGRMLSPNTRAWDEEEEICRFPPRFDPGFPLRTDPG
jgi:hypothetical protein